MRRSTVTPRRVIPYIILFCCLCAVSSATADIDFGRIEKIVGATGQVQDSVLVIRFPRSDLKVTIDGEPMPTALGFVSWTAWKRMGNAATVMGDLVLLEREINPVISAPAEANIEVTALHNHFLGEEPRILFMHIHGMGDADTLARGIHSALSKTATPAPVSGATSTPPPALDTKKIEEIIGHPGQASGGVFKITIGRPGVIADGIEVTSTMGLNSWAGFVGTNERAHVAGDVAMTTGEVNRVIRALRSGGIDVVAVHNHMLDEQPRIIFLHYWGTGPAEKLAQIVRAAFDQAKGPVK